METLTKRASFLAGSHCRIMSDAFTNSLNVFEFCERQKALQSQIPPVMRVFGFRDWTFGTPDTFPGGKHESEQ